MHVCTQVVYATICGWAYAFMTTVIPVSKGQECLYDYGHGYCECRGLYSLTHVALLCVCAPLNRAPALTVWLLGCQGWIST
jgi:hypothetical protein